MAQSPSVLIISFSPLGSDPRVSRQIDYFLAKRYLVTAIGESTPTQKNVRFLLALRTGRKPIQKVLTALRLLTHRYHKVYFSSPRIRRCVEWLKNETFDLIVANDIDALPLAVQCSKGTKIIFDAHEYAPREFESSLLWRIFHRGFRHYLCRNYLPKADKMITVCDSIADEYKNNFNVSPTVITNAPYRQALTPQSSLDNHRIRMIYQGAGIPERRIEDVIKIMTLLDERFTLDMVLVPGDEKYITKVKLLASKNKFIRFLAPVPPQRIPSLCNQYDVGIYPLKPNGINCRYCLPNKLFEFIQARIAIVVSPLPEIEKVVRKFECGVIAEDFEPRAFAKKLLELDHEKIRQLKYKADLAARVLCAEENTKIFDHLVEQSLTSRLER